MDFAQRPPEIYRQFISLVLAFSLLPTPGINRSLGSGQEKPTQPAQTQGQPSTQSPSQSDLERDKKIADDLCKSADFWDGEAARLREAAKQQTNDNFRKPLEDLAQQYADNAAIRRRSANRYFADSCPPKTAGKIGGDAGEPAGVFNPVEYAKS